MTATNFFDNTYLTILENSISEDNGTKRRHQWLLISKENFAVKEWSSKPGTFLLNPGTLFELGFLGYDGPSGVFIETAIKDPHHLEHKGCECIPQEYLAAVSRYLTNILVL